LELRIVVGTVTVVVVVQCFGCLYVASAPRYKVHKFRDWLLSGVILDIKPNLFGLEVLSYLAYETVAEVHTAAMHTVTHGSFVNHLTNYFVAGI